MGYSKRFLARGAAVVGLAGVMALGTAVLTGVPANADNPQVVGKKLSFTFLSTDPEHVVDVEWTNSAGVPSGNLVAEGGPVSCGDPSEFWGQSYGAPEGDTPDAVFGNHAATLQNHGKGKATITGSATDCASQPALPVTTQYAMVKGAPSEVKITRTFGFTKTSGLYTGVGLRPYVPRLSDGVYSNVIVPNGASTAVVTSPVSACPFDCIQSVGDTWNGKWIADSDPTSGNAMIIYRDPSMTSPVDMTMNYDGYSASNLSSFLLVQPTKGWKKKVTETEYLCFEDLTSWPQAKRDEAVLPSGCGPLQ